VKSSSIEEEKQLRITRILPKPLAIAYQEYTLLRAERYLEYYQMMARNLEERVYYGREELRWLKGE